MGTVDRFVRILAAVLIGILYFTDQITGTAAIVLGFFAVIFILTSAIGFCPLYSSFKISTKKKETSS